MGTSAITISALTATPSIQGNKLAAAVVVSGPSAAIPNLNVDFVEFYSSLVNDRDGTAALVATARAFTGLAETRHDGLKEEQTYYYWSRVKNRLGDYGPWYPVGNTNGVPCFTKGQAGISVGLVNGKLEALRNGSNDLVISILTASGNTPSASDPVFIAFRAAASGTYTVLAVTSALTLTVPSGHELGAANNLPLRIWVVAFNDGGTVRLAVKNCRGFSNNNTIYSLNEHIADNAFVSSAIGDLPGVFWSSNNIISKQFRIMGYLEWSNGLATAGVYSSDPDVKRLFGPLDKKPGDFVQVLDYSLNDTTQGTGTIPFDNTKPQKTEGNAYESSLITPTSKANLIKNELIAHLTHSVGGTTVIVALFQDAASNAIASSWGYVPAADAPIQVSLVDARLPGTLNQTEYFYRIGGSAAGTWYLGGTSGGAKLDGTLRTTRRVTEVMA